MNDSSLRSEQRPRLAPREDIEESSCGRDIEVTSGPHETVHPCDREAIPQPVLPVKLWLPAPLPNAGAEP